jgi:hypothetical protein
MNDHDNLFDRLGGTRAIAEALGEAPSTVQSWKTAKRIPAHKQPEVIEKYAARGVTVTADEMVWPFGRPEKTPSSADQEAA